MASRRSRLQIKPNVGGPKGLSNKVAAKPGKAASSNVSAAKLNNSPRKSAVSESVGTQKEGDDTSALEKKDETEKGAEIKQGNSNEDAIPHSPRASLRRFTKPITSSIEKSTSKDNSEEDTNTDITKENAKENENSQKDNIAEASSLTKHTDQSEEQQANMAKATTVPRRSRFPKAKPNVLDVNKKRQRTSAAPVGVGETMEKAANKKEEHFKESPQKRRAVDAMFPKQDVVIVTEDEILAEKTVDIDESAEQQPPASPSPFIPQNLSLKVPSGQFTSAQSPVKLPSGPVNRSRTMSTSEVPAVKRPRRTKIDIPTDKPPDRTTMKMKDLIHWNPCSNPMKQRDKPPQKNTVTIINEEKENKVHANTNNDKKANTKADPSTGTTDDDHRDDDDDGDDAVDDDSAMPVPQVTIGPDGNIIINERSLVVEDKSIDNPPSQDDEVIDETDNTTTYASFRQRPTFKRWNKKETTKFYKALAMIGADFFMIQKVFPNRTRIEIKKKFKREEKCNSKLIEKVLRERIHFDKSFLENAENDDSSDEEVETAKKEKSTKKEKGKTKKDIVKTKEKKTRKRSAKMGKTSRHDYFVQLSDDESMKQDDVSGNDKNDSTWQPPYSIREPAINNVERPTFSRRVFLTRELKKQAEKPVEEEELFYAVPAYADPSSTHLSVENMPGVTRMNTQPVSLPANINFESASTMTSATSPETNQSGNKKINDTTKEKITQLLKNSAKASRLSNVNSTSLTTSSDTVSTVSSSNTYPVSNSTTSRQSQVNSSPTPVLLPQLNNSLATTGMPLLTSPFGVSPCVDSSDQYVLVTVVPEGSEETVIHIYKLPGTGTVTSPQIETDNH